MRVRVVFRVNAKTGEVEHFVVEDISTEPEPEHDAVHDALAYQVGKVVERWPAPEQVPPGLVADAEPPEQVAGPEDVREREKATE
jgi:FtsH ternary system domain X3